MTDLKAGIDSNTIIVGGFNTPLIMCRPCRQNINKETADLNNNIDLTDIDRNFCPTAAEDTFFSRAHRTSSRKITF